MHWAARAGSTEYCSYFLSLGAEVTARDARNLTALDMAYNWGHVSVAALLFPRAEAEAIAEERGERCLKWAFQRTGGGGGAASPPMAFMRLGPLVASALAPLAKITRSVIGAAW